MLERINNNNPKREIINKATEILRRGGILVIPTETAYGLAADATNQKAVKKIYKIKGRNFKKFLPLIASSVNQIKRYFRVGNIEDGLLRKYKGLTIILAVSRQLSTKSSVYLLPKQDSCAVRVSTNRVASVLAKELGRPITATSANVSGGENCYSIEEVMKQLPTFARASVGKNLILDAGKLRKRKPSTIVRVEGDKIKVLRQGEVRIES